MYQFDTPYIFFFYLIDCDFTYLIISRFLRNKNEILHRIDQLTSGFYSIQIYTLRLNMCINFLRPPPILICSVYSSAVLWKVIVNCSNINNEWECVQNQKLQIHLLKNRCLESMLLKLYLNQVFIYRADRSIFIDQSISYGLPYDCIVSKRLHLW